MSIDLSATAYLDASVRRVPPPIWEYPRYHPGWEVPFGNLRIEACVRLPGAYRSLPRPSSAPKPSHPSGGVSCHALYEPTFDSRQISEASSTQHFIVDPGPVQYLPPAFFTLNTPPDTCTLLGSYCLFCPSPI